MIIVRKEGKWLDFSFSGEAVLSIDASPDGRAYVLGENGSVIGFSWRDSERLEELCSSVRVFVNPVVPRIGPLRRIKIIGDKVICAGSVGQVYELLAGKFRALPKLVVAGRDVIIEDIYGISLEDLTVVTIEGFLANYNGAGWEHIDLPTSASLSRISRLRDGRYVLVGKKGTVLIGDRDQWSIRESPNAEISYWGLGEWEGVLYVSHLGGIHVLLGDTLQALPIPDAENLEFTMLKSGPDGLWSFAGQTIGLIDERGWTTITSR